MKYLLILAILLSTYVCSASYGMIDNLSDGTINVVDTTISDDEYYDIAEYEPEWAKQTLHVTIDDDTVFEYKGKEYTFKELIQYIIWEDK